MYLRPLTPLDERACLAILRELPAWFGLEEGIAEAIHYLRSHAGFVMEDAGTIAGFLTWTEAAPGSIEISWMAVGPAYHRRGVGRALCDALLTEAQNRGARALCVKTLADSHPSPEYAITRAFYEAMGYRPLMVIPDLWDESNPCLIMARLVPPR